MYDLIVQQLFEKRTHKLKIFLFHSYLPRLLMTERVPFGTAQPPRSWHQIEYHHACSSSTLISTQFLYQLPKSCSIKVQCCKKCTSCQQLVQCSIDVMCHHVFLENLKISWGEFNMAPHLPEHTVYELQILWYIDGGMLVSGVCQPHPSLSLFNLTVLLNIINLDSV